MNGLTIFSRLFLVLSQGLLVAPNPRGAPMKACESLTAAGGHGEPINHISAPYKITVKMHDGKYKVRLEVVKKTGLIEDFRGFMLQARREGQTDAIGLFHIGLQYTMKLLTCQHGGSSLTPNTVTHSNNHPKTAIEVTWTPENPPSPWSFRFHAVVLHEGNNYWTNVTSDLLPLPGDDLEQQDKIGMHVDIPPWKQLVLVMFALGGFIMLIKSRNR